MTRAVVILGYAGVQALDLVGPFDVFTGTTLHLASQGTEDGDTATLVSIDGQPVATLTGLEFGAQPPPDDERADRHHRHPDYGTDVVQTVARWRTAPR